MFVSASSNHNLNTQYEGGLEEVNSAKSSSLHETTIVNDDEIGYSDSFSKAINDPAIKSSNHNISNNNLPVSKNTSNNTINNISNNNLPIESNKSITSNKKSKKEKTNVINSNNQKYFVNTQVNDVNSTIMSNPYCEKSQKTIEQSKSSVKPKSSVKKHFNPFYVASKHQSTYKNKDEFNNAALNNNFNDKLQYNQLCSNLDYYGVSKLSGTNKNSEKEIYINNIDNIDSSRRKYRSSSVDSASINDSCEHCSHCGHRIKRINNRKGKVKYCCCNNCCNNKCNIF